MRKTIAQAKRDLAELGIDARGIRVRTDGAAFVDDPTCVGMCVFDEPPIVHLRPTLKGARLYRTYLHEIAHAFGAVHTARGIMAPEAYDPADFSNAQPTADQRKVWAFEAALSILKARRRQWQPA